MIKENIFASPLELLHSFVDSAKDNPCITPVHISLYLALHQWRLRNFENPISVFSHDMMPLSKISGSATYHRVIRELDEFGYIRYVASFNYFLGRLIYFVSINKVIARKSMV